MVASATFLSPSPPATTFSSSSSASLFLHSAQTAPAFRRISYSYYGRKSSADSCYSSNDGGSRRTSLDSTIYAAMSPYERTLYDLSHNEQWIRDAALGKRVGFYRFKGDLGSGNFSQVRLAFHTLTKAKVAIKILDKTKLDEKTRRMLRREIISMDVLQHPHLIPLFEVVETLSKVHLVMEYARGGELYRKISLEGKLNEGSARSVYAQVMSAVEHMHSKNFFHRDIKAENVFYVGPDQVKLGDFGFSILANTPDQQLKTFCGSPPYAAPELFQDDSYLGGPVDIWASGVLLFFIVTGSMPFQANTVSGMKKLILEGKFDVPPFVSKDCGNLIRGILKQRPSERHTMQDIKSHSWIHHKSIWSRRPSLSSPTHQNHVDEKHWPRTVQDVRLADPDDVATEMERLGITKEMLEAETDRGARSSLIGIHRILSHTLHIRGNPPTLSPGTMTRIASAKAESDQNAGSGGGGRASEQPIKKVVTSSPTRSIQEKDGSSKKLTRHLTKDKLIKLQSAVKSKACSIL